LRRYDPLRYLTRQLRIDPKTHWFNEFLASYVGYAYLKAQQPRRVLSNEIFWAVALENSPHPFTRLDDFEARYDELQEKYPANYGWYQVALGQRVIEIYRDYGVGYLKTMRSAIPAGDPAMDSHQLLNTLERISPGWRAWAQQMQQETLSAGYSP
jgi:hypothetical protein